MTNKRTTNQTPSTVSQRQSSETTASQSSRKPSLDLDESTRAAAQRIRESGGPAADLADVLIQLDDASESDSTPRSSSSLAI
jgi:hypothetical protein